MLKVWHSAMTFRKSLNNLLQNTNKVSKLYASILMWNLKKKTSLAKIQLLSIGK